MVKLSEVDVPVIFKKQLLFKSGTWNGLPISSDQVNRMPANTRWDKHNSSLIYSHKDTNRQTKQPTEDIAEHWAGHVKNVIAENGNVYGDVHVFDPITAVAIKYGDAPFAISAGIRWPEQYGSSPKDIEFRNFSLVSNPAVKDKDIYFNFSSEDKPDHGFMIANFSAVMDSQSTAGSEVTQATNEMTTKDTIQKKKKMRTCKMCHGNYEDDEDEDEVEMPKDEFIKEHKELIETLKTGSKEEQIKEAESQEKELKEENMSIDRIDDSHDTKAQIDDVVKKKEWTMETLDSNTKEIKETHEENHVNYNQSSERRFINNINMTKDQESSMDKKMVGTKDANFEEAKTEVITPVEPVSTEQAKPSAPTPTASYAQASPVIDEKFTDSLVEKISSKLIPNLKPVSMTTHEFAGQTPQGVDPQEDAVERLAKSLVRK